MLAAPVTVRAGDELAGADVRLEPNVTFTVSGRVISPDQTGNLVTSFLNPATPASVGGLFRFNSSNPTDAQGNFTIQNVTPGSYRLWAQSHGVAGQQLTSNMELEVTKRDVENVTLTLSAGLTITENVYIEGGMTPAASEAVSSLNMTQVRVVLRGDDFLSTTSSQPSDSEGGFQIEGVVPGEYTIGVSMPNLNMYLKRILFGSEEVTPGDSVLVLAGFNGQLNVLVSPNGDRSKASRRIGTAKPCPTPWSRSYRSICLNRPRTVFSPRR